MFMPQAPSQPAAQISAPDGRPGAWPGTLGTHRWVPTLSLQEEEMPGFLVSIDKVIAAEDLSPVL